MWSGHFWRTLLTFPFLPFVLLIKAQTVYEANRSNDKPVRRDFMRTLVLDPYSLGNIRHSNSADEVERYLLALKILYGGKGHGRVEHMSLYYL
jgi:hypothetical protein